MSKVQTPKRPIPAFASWEEEAEFWDTHDLTDYFNLEYKPGFPRLDGPLSEPITLHIDTETMELVREIAAEQGLPPDGLLFIWILERRDAERARRSAEAAAVDAGRRDAHAATG